MFQALLQSKLTKIEQLFLYNNRKYVLDTISSSNTEPPSCLEDRDQMKSLIVNELNSLRNYANNPDPDQATNQRIE